MAENSRILWTRELRLAADLEKLGAYSLKEIRPALIQGYLDGLDGRPGKQAVAKAAFQALSKWAERHDHLARDITRGVETGRARGGHIPWTDKQVNVAGNVCRADVARAIILAANTGQRVSDLIRMGPADIETYRGRDGINVTQKKTGRQIWIPISTKLAAAIATWEVGETFLLNKHGKPWTAVHLRQTWDYEKRTNEQLKEHRDLGLVLHGLRGHCCVRLSRGGLTDHQIADIVGMSIPMVGRYTRLSSQKDNALAALDGTYGRR
jgi:integrase